MRVVLFVEGSAPNGSKDHCRTLWNATLLPALGRAAVDIIIPIGKDAISRMRGLRTSTSAPGLDARIVDAWRNHALDPEQDALVVAWDLEPIDPGHPRCAWVEKLGLYDGIAAAKDPKGPAWNLKDTAWGRSAAARAAALRELAGRPPTADNHSIVTPGSILGVCMDPMFEALLAHDGGAVRRALGLSADPRDWPSGWGTDVRDPSRLLGKAIAVLRSMRPRPEVARRIIREPWQNAKDEWGDYLLRKLLAEAAQVDKILRHPIARRLRYILPDCA